MVHHPYIMEEGPPPTIIEVNSQEYTEKTESMSIAGGADISSNRLSPYNKEGFFYRINNPAGTHHRQTVQMKTSQK